MQEIRPFYKKLPEKGESSKAPWTSLNPCRGHSFLRYRVTFFFGWWILSSSFGSCGLFYLGRRLKSSNPEIQTIYTSQPIIAPLNNPTPIAQVHLLLDTYSRPIPVIALFDTGAAATILHPRILPQEFGLPHHQMFRVANGETFLLTLKSKAILIRIFPTLTIKHQVLGSPLTGRDLIIGFDLLHQIPSLRWSPKGLMHRQHLLTWTQVPHLFTVDHFDYLKL